MTDNNVFFIVLVWGTFFHLKHDNKYVLNTVQWDSYWTLTTEAKKLIQMRLYRSDTDTSIDIDTINIWIDHLKFLILNNSFEVKWFTNIFNDKGTIWNTFSNNLFVIFKKPLDVGTLSQSNIHTVKELRELLLADFSLCFTSSQTSSGWLPLKVKIKRQLVSNLNWRYVIIIYSTSVLQSCRNTNSKL